MQLSSDRALPDLVHDSKIETRITPNYVEHIFYEPGQSPQERRRRKVEYWLRDVVLGKGAYGVVYREKRRDHGDSGEAVFRAVKEISKSVVHGEQLDYTRELEAVMKFSHQRVRPYPQAKSDRLLIHTTVLTLLCSLARVVRKRRFHLHHHGAH
jgi:2-hydroxychromene-2-carboxylate isomerase